MKTKIILLYLLILFLSCNKNNEQENMPESSVHLYFYENNSSNFTSEYHFHPNNNGFDNFANVITDDNGKKTTTFYAIDPKTIDNDFYNQLKIDFVIQGAKSGKYAFGSDEDYQPVEASINIFLTGDNINDVPDYISWKEGTLEITKFGKPGLYIEGKFDGTFKDSQLGNGLPVQQWPNQHIIGLFKIYRVQ